MEAFKRADRIPPTCDSATESYVPVTDFITDDWMKVSRELKATAENK